MEKYIKIIENNENHGLFECKFGKKEVSMYMHQALITYAQRYRIEGADHMSFSVPAISSLMSVTDKRNLMLELVISDINDFMMGMLKDHVVYRRIVNFTKINSDALEFTLEVRTAVFEIPNLETLDFSPVTEKFNDEEDFENQLEMIKDIIWEESIVLLEEEYQYEMIQKYFVTNGLSMDEFEKMSDEKIFEIFQSFERDFFDEHIFERIFFLYDMEFDRESMDFIVAGLSADMPHFEGDYRKLARQIYIENTVAVFLLDRDVNLEFMN